MEVKKVVQNLIKKHKTSNVYQLADCLNIKVHYHDLYPLRGYFYQERRIKNIVVDNNLPEHIRKFVLAHEIGHSVMHPNRNTPFLQSTLLSVDRLEIEANKFAAELIIPDDELAELREHTIDDVAALYGLPRGIIELRLK